MTSIKNRTLVGLLLILVVSKGQKALVSAQEVGRAEIQAVITVDGEGKLPPVIITFVATQLDAWLRVMTWPTKSNTSFFPLPGEYRIAAAGMPAGYSVKAFSAGNVNLLTDPFRIEPGNHTFRLILKYSRNPKPARVSGHVVDWTPQGTKPLRITLKPTMSGLKAVTTAVGSGGVFEFPEVLPGSYEVRFDPSMDEAQRVLGVDQDGLSDLKIRAFVPTFKVTGILPDMVKLQESGAIIGEAVLQPNVRLVYLPNTEQLLYRNLVRNSRARNVTTTLGYVEIVDDRSTKLLSKGRFEFKEVPAGTYRLSASFHSAPRGIGGDGEGGSLESPTLITVMDRDLTIADIELKHPDTISRPGPPRQPFVPPNPYEKSIQDFKKAIETFQTAVSSKADLRQPTRALDQASTPFLDYFKSLKLKPKQVDPEEFKEFSDEQLAADLLATARRASSSLEEMVPLFRRDTESVSLENMERFRAVQTELLRLKWLADRLRPPVTRLKP